VSLTRVPDVVLWDGSVGEGWVLVVSCAVCLEGATLGCSIAVNGTCLTATALTASTFTVGCAPETMRLTNLCDLQAGSPVNLERSARVDSRISGHYVQGHVDNTGAVAATWVEGDSLWVRVAAPAALLRYIVPKGYIACDGASLTVCEVVPPLQGSDTGSFTFMLIAYTQKHITLPLKKVGDRVNLEVDVQGKLAERAVGGVMAALGDLEGRLMAALGKLEGRVGALEAKVERL
jgi:riboflavin synthase